MARLGLHRSVVPLVPLLIWTLFVWSSRIRNVWTDEDLTTGGQVLRTGYAVVFLAFGIAMVALVWRGRPDPLSPVAQRVLAVFLAWTVVFWLIRGIGIIVDDHTASFTVIHTVLMVISIGLAAWAATAIERGSISSSPAAAR